MEIAKSTHLAITALKVLLQLRFGLVPAPSLRCGVMILPHRMVLFCSVGLGSEPPDLLASYLTSGHFRAESGRTRVERRSLAALDSESDSLGELGAS